MRTYANESEFVGAIDASLQAHVTSEEIRRALTSGIGGAEVDSRTDRAKSDGTLNLRLKSWVLRDQDMPVTELIGIVGAAATAALAPGVIAAGAVVAALSAFAKLAWQTWRKGATLSKAEVAVLGFL